MKIGTDGVLLGAWCDCKQKKRILDIGSGTGLIALMVAQKNPEAIIDAVEIDENASKESAENFKASGWGDRLNAICCDFLRYSPSCKYDLVVSNPPFFTTGETSPDKKRAQARHSYSLNLRDLFVKVRSMLTDDGVFAVVAPIEIKSDIEIYAGDADFWIQRRLMVKTTDSKPVKRVLWEFSVKQCDMMESFITIKSEKGKYSHEYIDLTKDFYLNM